MNLDNIKTLTTQYFELCWKSTIITSEDNDSEVPCVRVTKSIYTFCNEHEFLCLSYS